MTRMHKIQSSSTVSSLDHSVVREYYRRLGPAQIVLDLGCGCGDMGRWKPSPSIVVYGVDKNPPLVAAASAYEKTQALDLDQGALPFADNFFDAAVAKDILEHLLNPGTLLQDVRRVLRLDGRLLVSVPMPRARVVWNDYTHVRGFTKTAARQILEDNGFEVNALWKAGGIPLVGRLGLARWTPVFLSFPPMDWLFGSSYELLATKRS